MSNQSAPSVPLTFPAFVSESATAAAAQLLRPRADAESRDQLVAAAVGAELVQPAAARGRRGAGAASTPQPAGGLPLDAAGPTGDECQHWPAVEPLPEVRGRWRR